MHILPIGDKVRIIDDRDGFRTIHVDTDLATASISNFGGQILTWQPKSEINPVLWISPRAKFDGKTAIRGGVPICWPWFGEFISGKNIQNHGYARLLPWDISNIEVLACGSIFISMSLVQKADKVLQEYSELKLSINITVGESLTVELLTTNMGREPIMISEGLHTYFKIGEIDQISIKGLNPLPYFDIVKDKKITEVSEIKFSEEFGRIYLGHKRDCVIEDPILKREILIEKSGSSDTVVWNPWAEKSQKISDIQIDGWKEFVCVESANTSRN
jgi:D-hexose-6-phosphate mutarotase